MLRALLLAVVALGNAPPPPCGVPSLLAPVHLRLGPASITPTDTTPTWFLRHVAELTADSGRWLASNAEYRSEDEPYEAFVMNWKRGPGGRSATGELTALRDGKATPIFWSFVMYWHPGRNHALVSQVGIAGHVGEGILRQLDDGTLELVQDFFALDGSSNSQKHVESLRGRRLTSVVYDLVRNQWLKGRTYTWVRS